MDSLRGRLFKAVVATVLLYNMETWTVTTALEGRLNAAYAGLLRAAFGIHLLNKVANEDINQAAPVPQLLNPVGEVKKKPGGRCNMRCSKFFEAYFLEECSSLTQF